MKMKCKFSSWNRRNIITYITLFFQFFHMQSMNVSLFLDFPCVARGKEEQRESRERAKREQRESKERAKREQRESKERAKREQRESKERAFFFFLFFFFFPFFFSERICVMLVP